MKEEYPELLPPGFLTLQDIEDIGTILVSPFEDGGVLANPEAAERRRFLLVWFRKFLRFLGSLGVSLEIWIDGSFVSQKPLPEDVDVVVIFDLEEIDELSVEEFGRIYNTFSDNHETKIRYKCDAYMMYKGDKKAHDYWIDEFGSSYAGIPKGIVRVRMKR